MRWRADIIQVDPETKLEFIPASYSAVLDGGFNDEYFRSALDELRSTYRLIVLDTPPLLATSDALLYCRAADQTVSVCRWRSTAREAVFAAIEELRSAEARLTGIVVSMITARQKLQYSDTITPRDQLMLRRYYGH